MAIEVINTGSSPNDGTGDSLRTSFTKTNNNFSYLNSVFSGTGNISANSLTVTGNIILGTPLTFTPSGAALQYGATANAYTQLVMQNKSPLTNASTDFVATADNGTDSSYFVDLGIASSSYYYPGYDAILPNDSYLIANGGNLLLNAGSTGKAIKFVTGGSNNSNIVGQINDTAVTFNQTTISTSTGTGALQIAGGAGIAGNLNVGGTTSTTGGLMAAGTFSGTYSDGIILDYTTGTGRISVGAADGFALYNSGLAGYALMTISNTGNVVTTGNISSTGNLTAANLTLNAANSTISGSSLFLSGIKSVSYVGSNTFGSNTSSTTLHFLPNVTSRASFDINSNITVSFGGTINAGIEKFTAYRNKSATTANIILPTANNNKASNVIPVAAGAVASIWMVSVDSTAANVIMTVINN
jgi:hypothetical protein